MDNKTPPRQSNSTAMALYIVAALLLLNLVATLARDGRIPAVLPAAWGADAGRQAPIAGGGGLFIMPAQLDRDSWGVYLMDTDRGTLCVYQYLRGKRSLELVAARKFTGDTRIENMNTFPTMQEMADLLKKQQDGPRPVPDPAGGAPENNPAPGDELQKNRQLDQR
jgi:hypothetical protein